ncbi:MAG TPA: diguanylate cyclase [Gemmatimonadales bacterium]|nr:diguanylate cyclase [Gemmatimonadales bacterium]
MPLPSTILSDKLQALWEARAGAALRRIGLDSVRTTILTLAMLATGIPSLATGWLSYRQNRRAIEAKLQEQLSSGSTQSAREVSLWLKGRLYDLKVFTTSYEVTENLDRGRGSPRRLADYLNSVDTRFPDIQGLTVVAPDLRTVARSERAPTQLRLPDDWVRRARLGDAVLGAPVRGDSAATTTLDVAVPILSLSGRFLGAIVARLNFRGVEPALHEYLAGADGRVQVVGADGRAFVQVATRIDSLPVATLRGLEAADGAPFAYTAPDGVPVVGALARVPGTEWMVVAETPARTAYADIRRLRTTTLLLGVALLLVAGSLAYGLGLLVVLPLERLSRAAAQVAGGDLDVDLPASGGGEVAQLTGVFNDMVRRLRDGRAELERLSVTDELTGLANRRFLDAELAREVVRSERHKRTFAVLMLDGDRFKALNDAHGHQAGDAVLRQLAGILEQTTRKGDTVARFGGEEFLVILPETTPAGAAQIAERIRAATEAHQFTVGGEGIVVRMTVSVGYALFPAQGRTAEALITAADDALYRSKEGGRNRVTAAG